MLQAPSAELPSASPAYGLANSPPRHRQRRHQTQQPLLRKPLMSLTYERGSNVTVRQGPAYRCGGLVLILANTPLDSLSAISR